MTLETMKSQQPINYIINCNGQNQAIQFCVNQYCKNNRAFTCGIRKCICQQQHKLCSKASIDYVVQFIQAKVASAQQVGKQIEKTFSKIVTQILQMQQTVKKQIQASLKYSSLTEIELKLLKIVQKTAPIDTLCGELLSKLWKSININNQLSQQKQSVKNFSTMSQVQQKATKLQNLIKQNLVQYKATINKLSAKNVNINQNNVNEPKDLIKVASNADYNIVQHMLIKSSVISKDQQVIDLLKFFNDRKVQKMDLLYKASNNNFSMEKYYSTCGNEKDILILCKTKKNRILGGFSPLPLKSKNWYCQVLPDPSNTTFLFTLTNNEKFPLKDQKNAISEGNFTIKFGLDQFILTDNADASTDCKFALTSSFKSNSYKADDKQANLLLNGNSTTYFSPKEWQAWKVYFQPC